MLPSDSSSIIVSSAYQSYQLHGVDQAYKSTRLAEIRVQIILYVTFQKLLILLFTLPLLKWCMSSLNKCHSINCFNETGIEALTCARKLFLHLRLQLEQRPQTTLLLPDLSCAAAVLQLNLKTAATFISSHLTSRFLRSKLYAVFT